MTEQKQIHTQTVMGALRKGGKDISRSHTTAVAGWHHCDTGATVTKHYARPDVIKVEFTQSNWSVMDKRQDPVPYLKAYQEVLEADGRFDVEWIAHDYSPRLHVSFKGVTRKPVSHELVKRLKQIAAAVRAIDNEVDARMEGYDLIKKRLEKARADLRGAFCNYDSAANALTRYEKTGEIY